MPPLHLTATREYLPEHRILIIHSGTLRDVLATSPAPRMLQEALPGAAVSWLIPSSLAPFVQANPYVDEVILVGDEYFRMCAAQARRPLQRARDFGVLVTELRSRHFTATLTCRPDGVAELLARLSGAPQRIGVQSTARSQRLLLTDRVELPRHATSFTQSHLTALSPLGVASGIQRPVLYIPVSERKAAESFLAAQGLTATPYAVCHVSAPERRMEWAWPRWSELADELYARRGLRTVFVGEMSQRADILRLVEGCASRPVCAVGYVTPLQAAALVQDAALVVGCDSGLTYAGLTSAVPTVVLCGPTDPSFLVEEAQAAFCFHPHPCCPCAANASCTTCHCLHDISADEVANTACQLLDLLSVAA
ncbi:MAG: glycosyltransferase family 9 protein [Armatimonadota bacterium]